ncbi:MAG TPA: hypothetical protein VK436_10145 [Methanocella sp.]|nr:hypothetical protein [Methanocella sp.]
MIFPQCRFVGVNAGFLKNGRPSTDLIHAATQYVIVPGEPGIFEIYEISSPGTGAMLKEIGAVKKIATAGHTVIYEGQVDLYNRAAVVHKALQLCREPVNTVVFQGFDQHYSFVQDPSLTELTVVDVYDTVPPEPAKLAYNLKKMEEIGMFGDLSLAFKYHLIDLRQHEDPSRTTIFPCNVSGLKGEFMSCLQAEPQGDIKLVGCEATKKAFEARFPGKAYEHVNICPIARVKPSRPFLLRCDQQDRLGPIEIDGVPGAVVRFTANPPEIYEAVTQLAASLKDKSPDR